MLMTLMTNETGVILVVMMYENKHMYVSIGHYKEPTG